MTAKERENREKVLMKAFDDTIWMAIRYAHGRSTYAPSMVRDAVNLVKELFPDWKLKEDITVKPKEDGNGRSWNFDSDYLNDLFDK